MISKIKQGLLALCLVFGAISGVHAQDVYFGEDLGQGNLIPLASRPNSDAAQAQFIAALETEFGTEDFEGFTDGDLAPLVVDFGVGTATLLGSGVVDAVTPGTTNGDGRYAISGNNYWETDRNFTITFSESVRAFGFYGIDMGDFNGQLSLSYDDGTVQTVSIDHTINGPSGSVLYFGIIAPEPFTAVSFANSDPGDVFGFDDFTVARLMDPVPAPPPVPAIPVPTSDQWALILLCLLLGGVGLAVLRRD